MNFVAQVEDYLRDLGAEARKKHPGVKEASERAVLKLRALQNAYVTAVRQASKQRGAVPHPTTALFQSQDLLHPFVLAANYPNASYKLVDIALKAMRTLMEGNAICPGDGLHMVRVWMIQAHVCYSTLCTNKPNNNNNNNLACGLTGGPSGSSSIGNSSGALLSSSSTSSWFGFVGSSLSASSTSSSSTTDVSSSAGHAGIGKSTKKPECEKIALEILSCLVQLLELQDLRPVTNEQWTQSVALVCLLWNLPAKTKVQQAAHSTLPQVLAILFFTTTPTTTTHLPKFVAQTWEDLLALSTTASHNHLHGAFSQCASQKGGNTLPSPELALELMTNLIRQEQQQQQTNENTILPQFSFLERDAKIISKTFGVLLQLLQTKMSINLERTWRILSCTSTVIQTMAKSRPSECRELIQILVKFVVQATEACRTHDDFEDGFVYNHHANYNSTLSSNNNNSNHELQHRTAMTTTTASTVFATGGGGGGPSGSSNNPPPLQVISPINKRNTTHRDAHHHYATLIPNATLWKAGLALEVLYQLLPRPKQQQPQQQQLHRHQQWHTQQQVLLLLLSEEESLAITSEAMSDFSTIAASCRNHMLQLIETCRKESDDYDILQKVPKQQQEQFQQDESMIQLLPILSHRAEQFIANNNNHSIISSSTTVTGLTSGLNDHKNSNINSNNEKKKKSPITATSFFPPCDIGQALWIAFHGVIRVTQILDEMATSQLQIDHPFSDHQQRNNVDSNNDDKVDKVDNGTVDLLVARKVVEASFSPSLAALQHYLKRFPGSVVLTRLALQGYSNLATVAIPFTVTNSPSSSSSSLVQQQQQQHRLKQQPTLSTNCSSLQRKALLTSLSKLSLPSWGKRESFGQMQDNRVEAVMCLSQILHRYSDSILSEWHVILATFEELSVLAIASPLLSDQGYKAALSVSALFGRFASFSTCLSDESLMCMIAALAEISNSSATSMTMTTSTMAGRTADVIPVGSVNSSDLDAATAVTDKSGSEIVSERKASFSMDDGKDSSIGGKLMSLGVRAIYGSQPVEATEAAVLEKPIVERTKNTYQEEYRKDFLKRLAAFSGLAMRSDVDTLRIPFALMTLIDIASTNLFRFKRCEAEITRQLCVLAGCETTIRSFVMDMIAMLAMSHLTGNTNSLSSFAGPGKITFNNPKPNQLLLVEPIQTPPDQQVNDDDETQEYLLSPLCDCLRTTDKPSVAEDAISALRSILESAGHTLTGEVWAIVINAVASLSGDATCSPVNRTSMEWSNCCLLAFRCLKLIVDDFLEQLPPLTDANGTARSSLLNCCSSFGRSRHDVNTSLTAIGLLWTIADQDAGVKAIDLALSKLVLLAADTRPEVRNCSVNTLFSCIVGRGSTFSPLQWKACIVETIFGVYQQVLFKWDDSKKMADEAKSIDKTSSSRYKVSVHHSRDSVGKQWLTTQLLVLRGLNRILRGYFSQLLDTLESVDGDESLEEDHWFERAWTQILDFALGAAQLGGGRDTLDVRTSAVDLLLLCAQLSCRAGVQAAITPARVGTNMEVVNGALKSVRESIAQKNCDKAVFQRKLSSVLETWREDLFLEAFDVVDDFHKHLHGGPDSSEGSTAAYMESTWIQVLHKFSSGLAKLYDCCKDDELKTRENKESIDFFISLKPSEERDKDDLEGRFVDIVAAVARFSGSGASSRFLSQAQRCSMDLLKTMAVSGSGEATKALTILAGVSFIWTVRKETDDDPEDDEKGSGLNEPDLLCREAGSTVADIITNDRIAHDVKIQVLCRVLHVIITESSRDNWNGGSSGKKDVKGKRCYKFLVPVLQEGLRCATILEKEIIEDEIRRQGIWELLQVLWDRICSALAQLLSPIAAGPNVYKFPRNGSLIEILAATSENVPKHHYNEYCAILSSVAWKSMEITEAIRNATRNADGESSRKLKKLSDEASKIFNSCFNGICQIQPEDTVLPGIVKRGLTEALAVITEQSTPNRAATPTENELDFALVICQALRSNENMESLVIAVFPQLCMLVGVENALLRTEIGQLLGTVNVGNALEEAKNKCVEAEKRAVTAEKQVEELKLQVNKLRDMNESLQQQVAVFSASSALS